MEENKKTGREGKVARWGVERKKKKKMKITKSNRKMIFFFFTFDTFLKIPVIAILNYF